MVTKVDPSSLRNSEEMGLATAVSPWLVINQPKLLEMLHWMKASPSIGALRLAALDLKQQLAASGSLLVLPPENGEAPGALRLRQGYLLSELEQIAQSLTLERARYYLDRFEKGLTQVKTSDINDINLNRWKEYQDIFTDSLWIVGRRDRSGVHRAEYWGNFIPQIPNQLLKRYTKQGDWVLDTFAGSGTTLIESQRLGRNSLGIELQSEVCRQSRELVASEPNPFGVVSEVVTADSATVDYGQMLGRHGQSRVQLLIMHPPYFDIIRFSDDERDLSNAASVERFLQMIGQVLDQATPFLERGRYLALVIGDKFSKGEWIPLGFLTMNEVVERGFLLKSIIVKNFEETAGKRNQKELWKYRALVGGFYIFKHEYIFIFKKK